MAESMIRGLLDKQLVEPGQIWGSNPLADRNEEIASRYGVSVTESNKVAVKGASIVVLATKPQAVHHVFKELKGSLPKESLLLSICAGVPISALQQGLGQSAVCRSMPNTPAQIGMGMTVWTATKTVSDTQKDQAKLVFASLGQEVYLEDEEYLDMATALSGSGPAYVFLLMEAMIDAGVHMGFSRRVAHDLVMQTLAGSVEYAAQSGRHPAELKNQVTSPGGTTAEALYRFEKGGFRTVLSRGIFAAYEKSVELGQGFEIPEPNKD